MPIVIILFLIFFVLIAHIGYLKIRNWRLEKKLGQNSHHDADDEDRK